MRDLKDIIYDEEAKGMKKILIALLVLALLCVSLAALAEDEITLQLNTSKVQVYAADDPYLKGLTAEGGTLPVIVVPVKRSFSLQVTVQPRTVRNKKVSLSVDNGEVAQIKGSALVGLKPGEAVLTITSQEDPSVSVQYRVVVIQALTRISLTASSKNVAVGGTVELTPAFLPEDATRKEVTWASSDERIATVDGNGVVTGVKRGTVRITATATDGSNVRANISIAVTQSAEEITLAPGEVTIDVGRSAVLRATVLPKDTNNRKVVWSSSDESVATVNQGRVTGVALGDCEIICTSEEVGTVQAKAVVHVQQPVTKVTLGEAPVVYNGESAKLTWTTEPANASNPKLKFISSNEKVVTVSDDGTITGVAGGDAYIRAVTTDGSNRQAYAKVKVMQHLTGVHMLRRTAYIDPGQMSSAGAVLEPKNAKYLNPNMTWESANTTIATVVPEPKAPNKIRITGVNYGETDITGITEDGGFQTSIHVRIDDWEKALRWTKDKAYIDGKGRLHFQVKNTSSVTITSITVECECYGFDGKPAEGVNPKDGSNIVRFVYRQVLAPGATTKDDTWKPYGGYDPEVAFKSMIVRINEFQIDNDWVKQIRKNRRPKTEYKPK